MHPAQTSTFGTPPAEVQISGSLVRDLLIDQHPDLAHLPLEPAGEGWDNALFRLGDDLAVRLPRRLAAANLISHEQTWLPRLAARLSLPVPVARRIGKPARNFPWHWSVVPWLKGQPAHHSKPAASQAGALGLFLRSLHIPAPADAPINPFRGVPLQQRATSVGDRLKRLSSRSDLISAQLRQIWDSGLQAPIDAAPTWLHADLHPLNILVEEKLISGIIDWGDMTSGDPATDLASIWMLFADPKEHQDALETYGNLSASTLRRAKAWALFFGVMFLDNGLTDNPVSARLGETILRQLIQTV